MQNIKTGSFVKAMSLTSVFALSVFGATELRSSQLDVVDQKAEAMTYGLTVSDAVAVTQLIQAVGGEVANVASGVGTVQARLTQSQLELVTRSDDVSRVSTEADSFSSLLGATGRDAENQVAGVWWNR